MYGVKLSFPNLRWGGGGGGGGGGFGVRNFTKASRINLRFCSFTILGNWTQLDLTGLFTQCIRRVTNPKCVSLEVVEQNHKHGDHYEIVKGHV